MKRKRLVTAFLTITALLSMNVAVLNTSAESFRMGDKGNYTVGGGINRYGDIKTSTREETELLEYSLLNDDYILISTDDKMITDEEFEQFKSRYPFWFGEYLVPESYYEWTFFKVYVYKPSYDDFMEQTKDGHYAETYTLRELQSSTVVISYAYWNSKELAGTFDYAINNAIPSWCNEVGFIKIKSPVSCNVILHDLNRDRYYEISVPAYKAITTKLRASSFIITEINGMKIAGDRTEETLPYNNLIQLGKEYTYDNPYTVDIGDAVRKYSVPAVDISNKPDCDYVPANEEETAENETGISSTVQQENNNAVTTLADTEENIVQESNIAETSHTLQEFLDKEEIDIIIKEENTEIEETTVDNSLKFKPADIIKILVLLIITIIVTVITKNKEEKGE